jgi:nicotinamidase/pyrazinamidase
VAEWGVIVVDVQGDFTEWKQGSLAVPGSDEGYVKSAEASTRLLRDLGLPVFATQDWHPPDHVSFATRHPGKKPFETTMVDGKKQDLWPPHCVQGTEGARLLIDDDLFLAIVKKAHDRDADSYSGFQRGGEMDALLQLNGVRKVIVYGLATDYCVKATALGLLAAGYRTTVIEGLCRSVSGDTAAAALDEMSSRGIRIVSALDGIIEELHRDILET